VDIQSTAPFRILISLTVAKRIRGISADARYSAGGDVSGDPLMLNRVPVCGDG
jgi:hypothetical protein